MEGPALKRPKLQVGDLRQVDWSRSTNNLETLQEKLISGCVCHVQTLDLQRPIFPVDGVIEEKPPESMDIILLRDYALQFISTINFLSDSALKQSSKGYICPKILDMASGVAMDEGIWEMLIEYLNSTDKFVTLAASKCLISLFMWTKLPNLSEIFDELFSSVMNTNDNPLKLCHILDIIRGVVEYKYESDHPLELVESNPIESQNLTISNNQQEKLVNVDNNSSKSTSNNSGDVQMMDTSPPPPATTTVAEKTTTTNEKSSIACTEICLKIEVETEVESEVKTLCVKALENWWNRLLEKFQNMMAHFQSINESPVAAFLALWLSIISVKNNLSVIDTKHYYMHLEAFVPLLNPNSPPIVWKMLTAVFNEILCYGSTLSLQDIPNDEPCDLAHLIIRCVRSHQFLQGMPYSRDFLGFGGSTIGPVDWEWKSENQSKNLTAAIAIPELPSAATRQNQSSSTLSPLPSTSSSSISASLVISPQVPSSSKSLQQHNNNSAIIPITTTQSSAKSNVGKRAVQISQTIYIGPSREAVQLDESFEGELGDRPLLQKVVLLVLKSVAVTVQESRADEEADSEDISSEDGSMATDSESESEANVMVLVEKSVREVFLELDLFVKSLQPFHPGMPLGEWMLKLFSDQDDALVEAMICVLDTYRGFLGKREAPADFKENFHPVKIFISFLNVISNDKEILLDWLMGNETCFLLYLLNFLKFSFKNWSEFVSICARDLEGTMSVLIRLRMSVGRLVERSLFPYNINPVLRLLEKCEELYETNGGNSSSSSSS